MTSSPYDAIAELYDPWSASVTEDVGFYLAEARRTGGPVVELGVGTGRIAVPIAQPARQRFEPARFGGIGGEVEQPRREALPGEKAGGAERHHHHREQEPPQKSHRSQT